jgi:hypothetical protein
MHPPAYDVLPARLLAKIDFNGPCYLAKGGLSSNNGLPGYTRTMLGTVRKMTHRWVWELLRGPLSPELSLDHLCRNTRCVRLEHLDPVPHRINVLRGNAPAAVQSRRTECIHGHPLSGENLVLRNKGRKRQCRICERAWHQARDKAKRLRRS